METAGQRCAECGTLFPDLVLACPVCQKLVHADELKRLAAQAATATARGDASAELAAWRSALELLPAESKQHAQLRDKVAALGQALDAGTPGSGAVKSAPSGALGKTATGISALGLLLWKLKVFVLFLLTKLKFLALGLTKAQTFFSMLLTMGIYFSIFGWKFAVGFVLSIYVHEMGHVAALHKLGIAASAPMFVPGFGAFVRMHQYPSSPSEDARVGLAGPLWGLGAALFCALMYRATGAAIWAALAHTGAIVNLFNLIPIWQLDGARGFHALTKNQRLLLCGVMFAAWLGTRETLLLLLMAVGLYRAFGKDAPTVPDRRAFFEFVLLIGALSLLQQIHGLPAKNADAARTRASIAAILP